MPKRNIPRLPQIESYLFEIIDVEPTYSFHAAHERFEPGSYGEHLHIELTTTCLKPKKFQGWSTEFTFIGKREVIPETLDIPRGGAIANGVGTLTMRRDHCQYLGTLPYDAASTLPLMVLAGGYRFIYLSGPPTYRGSSRIQSSSFYRQFDPDDL